MSTKDCVDSYHIFDTLKNIHLPSWSLPEIHLPTFNLPEIQLPTFLKPTEEIKDLRAHALELERKTLINAGFKIDEDIFIYDVPIDYHGANFMHTVELGRENEDVLILFPGYCGTVAYMSLLLKGLAKKFHIYHVDYLGQGLSSRPDYPCTTSEEAIQYFIESFECWRKELKLESYFIAGHSLGGYVAPLVAHADQKRCRGLFLMSPKGVGSFDSYEPNEEWVQGLGKVKSAGWMAYFQLYERAFGNKTIPYDMVQKNPGVSKIFMKKYMAGFMKENQEQGEAIGEALHAMMNIPGGSGQCIHLILRPPRLAAYVPLPTCIFPEMKDIPIYCYFGVEDWNDWTEVKKYAEECESKNVFYVPIESSGHQMTMQNPDLVVEKIMSTFESQ